MTTTLVLGGTRSGKSRYAQTLLPEQSGVTFIAPGPLPSGDDPEWAARVQRHRSDRPDGWATVESAEVVRTILYARGPVLLDCLGAWVTSVIDGAQLWDDHAAALDLVDQRAAELAALWSQAPYDSVAVTNEVGMSLVPTTPAGRLFTDALGRVNVAISRVSDRVHLVVAGRLVDLSGADPIPLPQT